jgi:hypothetical protein
VDDLAAAKMKMGGLCSRPWIVFSFSVMGET